ncbi:MAG: hypothetical protein WB471_05325 [Nocardioides sp.]
MSEFTPLREAVDTLASRTPSPNFGELQRRATRRRRRRVVMVAAATVAVIAVGGGLAAGTLGGNDRVSPMGEPTTPSSESPRVQESAESSATVAPDDPGPLDAIFQQVPSWTYNNTSRDVRDFEPAVKGPCSGNWARAGAFVDGDPSKGEVAYLYSEVAGQTILGSIYFPSEAHASDAAARLVEGLESCTATAWATLPVARTGAVLASSAEAVAWIQHTGADVMVLVVPTTDGPPPADMQVEVTEWMVAHPHSRGFPEMFR